MSAILTIDQGTTGSQASILTLPNFEMVGNAKVEFAQIFPSPGWVEHDPEAIWESVLSAAKLALEQAKTHGVAPKDLNSIGITNQRETVLAWNRKTGERAGNAIVWQDRRTAERCDKLNQDSRIKEQILAATGLVIDPYFSASKMEWLLQNNKLAAKWAKEGQLALGTIDSFLIYRLTAGREFVTEPSNASRTQLFDIRSGSFSSDLCKIFSVPHIALAEVRESDATLGVTRGVGVIPDGIPITGCLGDQQAALFGQGCFEAGEAKITYGTGAFILLNIGEKISAPPSGLITTVASTLKGKTTFAFEGSAFIAGAAMQYLRDNFSWFKSATDGQHLALSEVRDPNLLFVPALAGLGAPYWNASAKGALLGLSRGSTKAQVTRAVLESIALQNVQLLNLMTARYGSALKRIGVDGGAAMNDYLMQFQADTLRVRLDRPKNIQSTSLGAAMVAYLGQGGSLAELKFTPERSFRVELEQEVASEIVARWLAAVEMIDRFYR